MTQLNLTLDANKLTDAILNCDLDQVMKSTFVTVLNAYMESERDQYMKSKRYERDEDRCDYRNGYDERDFTTKIGTLKLNVPRTRSGDFHTQLFERNQRMDQGLLATIFEMYVNGISTRKMTKVVESLCGQKVSKSFVSDVNKHLDKDVFNFQKRSLTHTNFRYIYVDAMYIKVREDNRVVSKALYIAQGVNDENRREIIGFKVAGQESTESWRSFFLDLKARGIDTPKMVISDAHAGLRKAIQECFVNTTWQRCTFHLLSNITDALPKTTDRVIRDRFQAVLFSRTQQEARERKQALEAEFEDQAKLAKALSLLDEGFEDAIQYQIEPSPYHMSLRTTHSIERVNREIRRRERVVGIFPNIKSAERLAGSVLLNLQENWEAQNDRFLR